MPARDRRARFIERALDSRIAFLGDGCLERRQRAFLARLEDGLRGIEAFAGVVGKQRQAADRGVDRAAQAIVEPHRGEIVGGNAARGRAGRRIPQRVGFVLDVDFLGVCVEIKPAVLQCADDLGRARIAACGKIGDRLIGVGIFVGGEAGERIVERLRATSSWLSRQINKALKPKGR